MRQERERASVPVVYEGAEQANAPALVVGIGASSGGLAALEEFFRAPTQSEATGGGAGIAFIVVAPHLGSDPDLDTASLAASIARWTDCPVREITDGMLLEPDHVFVAPPDVLVELKRTTLHCTAADGVERPPRPPIDTLLRSLAEAFGPRCVGVVLSGTGTDGTPGLQQIANAGGMTLAQDPEHVELDSMLKSAIDSGTVDHVLPAAQMMAELLAYAGHVRLLSEDDAALPETEAVGQALGEICDILQQATEHNFKHYKTSTLIRRIQRRMQVLRLSAAPAYVDWLRRDAEEVTQLFRELLIGVTAFFRDPEAFDVLTREVLRPLMEQRRGGQLRFWVPGCATGEEAYSLAIVVRELLLEMAPAAAGNGAHASIRAKHGLHDPPEIQIFATDIDERALSLARQGVYPAGIAEQVSRERLERFFIKRGARYQVTKEVREVCLFSPHNLIADPPFSRLDLISCRNLLIYFGPHLQKKLIPLFHYALRPNGYLFLGPSENLSSHKELFAPVSAKHRISQRKATALRSSPILSGSTSYRGALRPLDAGQENASDLHQVMQRILLDEFAPKSVIVTEEGQILSASGDMQRYLTVTEGTFQNNVVRLARPGLRVGLRAALSESIKVRRKVVHDNVSVQVESGTQRVRLTVQPMPRLGEEAELFIVVFQDFGNLLPREDLPTESAAEVDSLIEQLERELGSTRNDLEKTIQDLEAANEELKSSNEELLSMNEELQSANEELETSKEEVQSSNEALARAHANLSNLLTSTEIATIFLDDDLEIQSFTPAVTQIYNLLASDVGRPLSHLTHRARSMPKLPTVADLQRGPGLREDNVVTEDERHFLRRCLLFRTHEGKHEGMVVTFLEVTALKRVEELASRHQRQLQLITDALPVLISYIDSEQRYRFNNRAYERWFGVAPESMAGRHVAEVFGDEVYGAISGNLERALAGEATSYEAELPFQQGGTRAVAGELVPDRGPDGLVRGVFAVVHDVSEQQRNSRALAEAKSSAERANQAKSEFLANMSHEIRTPMSAILGYAELLTAHLHDPDNLACVQAIKRNGQHLVEIINDILDLSKIEAGMLRADRIRFAPLPVMREVVDALRVRAVERGLVLRVRAEGLLPETIESDPTRLRQILMNLLGNALKFTNHGSVTVVASLLPSVGEGPDSEPLLEVRVIDTGIGIAPEHRALLFEPFTQGDSSVTRQYGGTGLGLAISKRLVELLGGTIQVESTLGAGSTFSFTLRIGSLSEVQLTKSESRSSVPPPLPPLAASLSGYRVLVVDDRRDMRYLVQTYLEEAGAEVLAVGEGATALGQVASTSEPPFRAIVLDMQMPVMDGYVVARKLREVGFSGRIIAVTANAMKGDREACLAAGCDDYLAKPVDRLRLLESVARAKSFVRPAVEAPEAAQTGADGQPVRVLLVDDNEDATYLLGMLLETRGFEVLTAHTGRGAIELAETQRPDVVVLDLGLPDIDGFAVLTKLQSLSSLAACTFIALSGRSMPEEQARIEQAGFHEQFVKPADTERLVAAIKAQTGRSAPLK